jgi:hypothetical protein
MLKKLLFLGYVTLLFCGVMSESVAQSISSVVVTNTSGAIPSGGYCAGQSVRVSFSTSGFTGSPTFSVQLSDASGVFPAVANVIGSGTSSPISAVIPVGTTAGSGYKIRVTSGVTTSVGSVAFVVNPVAIINPVSNLTICSGVPVSGFIFSSSSAGVTYSWTSSVNIGFGTSGSGNIPSFTAVNNSTFNVSTSVTVTPSVNGCTGVPSTFTITVRPSSSVNPVSNVNLCNGATGAAINFSSPIAGTTFAWTSTANVGFGTTGSGNIAAYTATNPTSAPITATVTVTPIYNGCNGSPQTFTVTVNPTNSTVNPVASTVYCDDASASAINFSSPIAGATFDWVSSVNVGFGTSGSGNIPAFIANNNGTSDAVTTVTVTPKVGGCAGTPTTFTVTVKSRATVNSITNVSLCNGATGSAIGFSSPTAGTTFSWSSSANVGFGLSGTSGIPSYTATNSGTSAVTSTVTVTPTAGGCVGTSSTFTVTVNPTTSVNSVSNASFCGGIPVSGVTFSSPVSGTTYAWTSSANVGFGTSGTGNIPAYTTISSNTTQVVATITVVPSVNGCAGVSKSFTITINPTPTVNTITNAVYCNSAPATAIAFSSPVAGTTFSWTSSSNVGFGVSGITNIAAYTATNATTSSLISTVSVTPTTGTCTGPATTFTVTVHPTPAVSTVPNAVYCGNTSASAITFSSTTPNTTYAWGASSNVGFGTTGTGNIGAYTTLDSANTVVGTITVTPTANSCVGTAKTFTITINPSPKVNSIANAVYCNGISASAISFTSSTTGATFTWASSANAGFGTTGSGNIPTYTATNAGSSVLVATVNATAKTATCTGPARPFTVTVNPTPIVTPISNLTYCGTATATPLNFTSLTSGTTYAWTSSNNVGFGTSGTGNIASYTVINPTRNDTIATVTVRPTANTCQGLATTFTITVRPTPVVNTLSNVTLCAGATGTPIAFSSATPNTNFSWTTPTNVGFGTSGTGNIAGGFTAANASQSVVTATVSVIPATATCTGKAETFTFVVIQPPLTQRQQPQLFTVLLLLHNL